MSPREFCDREGVRWTATVISSGKSSDYLNQRVQRPLIQFDRKGGGAARRYSMLDAKIGADLESLTAEDLLLLLDRSKVH